MPTKISDEVPERMFENNRLKKHEETRVSRKNAEEKDDARGDSTHILKSLNAGHFFSTRHRNLALV